MADYRDQGAAQDLDQGAVEYYSAGVKLNPTVNLRKVRSTDFWGAGSFLPSENEDINWNRRSED